jgi:hypothetical protein
MSSTTPQDRAVGLITAFIAREVNADSAVIGFVRLQAVELAEELADAGLLSSGTQEEEDGSLRSKASGSGEGLSVYVYLRDGAVADSATLNEHTIDHTIDYDACGRVVGVEILGAISVGIDGVPVRLPEAIGVAAKEKP